MGPPVAPEARDTSNYRFVRQTGLKTLLLWKTVLIISIFDISLSVLYYGLYFILFIVVSYIYIYFLYLLCKVGHNSAGPRGAMILLLNKAI